jgi:hypothetical protein
MQRALEAAVAELVHGKPLAGPDDVDAWLSRHALSGDDARSLRESLGRLLVYRELVEDTIRSALLLAVPRTAARLGPLFDEYLARFLADRGPRTHYLRDVTGELLEFCAPLWEKDARVPAYVLDLARHEALMIGVAASADAARSGTDELDLGSVLLFAPSLTVVRYAHAVHRLPPELEDRSEPERTPVALAVYRDARHEVRYLELTPLAAALLDALMAGESLGAAVTRACGACSVPVEPAVLSGASRLLGDLSERGCLLGVDPLKARGGSNKVVGSTAAEEPK